MYSRPVLTATRLRLLSQIRWRSEPSTSSDTQYLPNMKRTHRTFVDTVLKGHSQALEEMEKEIEIQETERMTDLKNNENVLLSSLLPHLQSKVIANSRFIPVGSAITGLASSHSDLDVVLFPTERTARDEFTKIMHSNDGLKFELMSVLRSKIVHTLYEMGDARFEVKDCVILPLRVPLIICQFTNGTSIDISIPDSTFQSIRNTHLMRQYAKCDMRVGRLLNWLKMWSSALEIRDSKMGLLSSYHLLLLVVHFLHSGQALSVPVLPVLYQHDGQPFHKDIPIENIVALLEEPPSIEWKSNNRMSTAELVIRFIDYYGKTNLLAKNIHIDRGMERDRTNPTAEQAAIFDPYSTTAACRSLNALRAFKDAIEFTQRGMRNGFMFNPFSPSPDSSFANFITKSQVSEWRMAVIKHKARMTKERNKFDASS